MDARVWKYLVFLSPSLIHFAREFWARKTSFRFNQAHRFICAVLRLPNSDSDRSLSFEMISSLWIWFSKSSIFRSMWPKSDEFHAFSLLLVSFNLSAKPSNECEDHTPLTICIQPGCDNQQFWNLKGRGPQSKSSDFTMMGQWSDRFLLWTEMCNEGNFEIHSGFTNKRSSLLFRFPLNHVNQPSEAEISIKCVWWMKILKSLTPEWEKALLPLSFGPRTSLKSPITNMGDCISFQYSERDCHTLLLLILQTGLYKFTRTPRKLIDGISPYNAIQLFSTFCDINLKYSGFHIDNSPPEFPVDGVKSQSMSSAFHMVLIVNGLKCSILVSWIKTNFGSCLEISFLNCDFFILALRPLKFQDMIIITKIYGGRLSGNLLFMRVPNLNLALKNYLDTSPEFAGMAIKRETQWVCQFNDVINCNSAIALLCVEIWRRLVFG